MNISRRKFLKTGTCGAMSAAPLVNSIAQLNLVNSAAALEAGESYDPSDYKALVCLFLKGGMDTNNVLIPLRLGASQDNPSAALYAKHRTAVRLDNGVNPDGTDGDINLDMVLNGDLDMSSPFGLNFAMPKMRELFNEDKKLAFVANVGSLAEHLDRDTFGNKLKPNGLYSHSDQQMQWQSSISDNRFATGWGGRCTDILHEIEERDLDSPGSMVISLSGNTHFITGGSRNNPIVVNSAGSTPSIKPFGGNAGDYPNVFANSEQTQYLDTAEGRSMQALEAIIKRSRNHILEKEYTKVYSNSRKHEAAVKETFIGAADYAAGIQQAFDDNLSPQSKVDKSLLNQLQKVLEMIAGRRATGMKRQLFFVSISGFDHHANMYESLQARLPLVDDAVYAFMKGLDYLASADPHFSQDMATLFECSDFSRSFTANGTRGASVGTDHAWGTHVFVAGGAVKGGQIYGAFPELQPRGLYSSGSKGRWIPTTSVDQYCAVLARWMGVPEGDMMRTIFPNLDRFRDPFDLGSGANLDFMDMGESAT